MTQGALTPCPVRVIFDQFSRFCLPDNVRFAPKADLRWRRQKNKRCPTMTRVPCLAVVPCFLPCTCLSERYIQTAFIGTVLEPVRRNEHRYRCRRAAVLLGAASYRLSGV